MMFLVFLISSEIHPEADIEKRRILKSQRNALQPVRRKQQIGKPVVKVKDELKHTTKFDLIRRHETIKQNSTQKIEKSVINLEFPHPSLVGNL